MSLAVALAILALRGIAAVTVVTELAGGLPRIARTALAVALGAWAAAFAVDDDAAVAAIAQLSTGGLAVVAVHELAIGGAIGLAAALPLLAATAAGAVVDSAGRARRGPYAPLFGILAAAVFVGVDGHVIALRAIVDSYAAIPATSLAAGDTQASALASIFALVPIAVRLAAPWLVTAAVVEIAAGAGARVGGRAAMHAPIGAAAPAALAMMTAALVGTLAVAIAALVRAA